MGCDTSGGYPFALNKRHIHFDVDERLAKKLRKHQAAVEVEYFDEGDSNIFIEYDSTDPLLGPCDPVYKKTEYVKLSSSGEWKKHRFVMENPSFANRQRARTDFRVCVDEGNLFLRKITVTKN